MAYYKEWAWIEFLSSISELKVFDIAGSGLDSIECAKAAKAYKVLLFASRCRDKSIAEYEAYKI